MEDYKTEKEFLSKNPTKKGVLEVLLSKFKQHLIDTGEMVPADSVNENTLRKAFDFMKNLTAEIVYECNHDYSAGVKGAEICYVPETFEKFITELGVSILPPAPGRHNTKS